jgi:hypothetical protein
MLVEVLLAAIVVLLGLIAFSLIVLNWQMKGCKK